MAAPQICAYDAPIAPAELQHAHAGFSVLPHYSFIFSLPPPRQTTRRRSKKTPPPMPVHMFYKINDKYFDATLQEFDPGWYYDQQTVNEFVSHANNPHNLTQVVINGADVTMFTISNLVQSYECQRLQPQHPLGMFCSQPIASQLRMKLFCAFGMLSNFVNPSKVELLVRGGMALRLQLQPGSELINSASETDIDGLIIVDRHTMTPSDLQTFKTTFMKLLVLSIKLSVPPNMSLICTTAAGDKNTIKIKLNTVIYGIQELGDFGFKYSDDEIVQIYKNPLDMVDPSTGVTNMVDGVWPMSFHMYPGILKCVWKFPHIQNMKKEYELVHGNLMSESRARHMFEKDYTALDTYEAFYNSLDDKYEKLPISKFEQKKLIADRGYGGKKRTMKKYAIKMRGGSTTEQIGAAAQMRAFLPRHSATRNALNHIVHHESNNRFHDANYRHSPATQAAINRAFRAISANPRVSRRTKKHMKIAKQKASTHRR